MVKSFSDILIKLTRVTLSGRKFNENGEVVEDWWSSSSSQGFKERSECIVEQYNKYSVDVGDGKRENVSYKEEIVNEALRF